MQSEIFNMPAELNKIEQYLSNKQNSMLNSTVKRIEDFEKSSRTMLKIIYQSSIKNRELLLDMERKVKHY